MYTYTEPEGELACRDCGSTHIIDEVVDFCADCRSYNISFRLPSGVFEEDTEKFKEETKLFEEETKLFEEKQEIEKRERKKQQEKDAISLDILLPMMYSLRNIATDYMSSSRKLEGDIKKEFLSKSQEFRVNNIPDTIYKIKNLDIKPYLLQSYVVGQLRRLDRQEAIYTKANLPLFNLKPEFPVPLGRG